MTDFNILSQEKLTELETKLNKLEVEITNAPKKLISISKLKEILKELSDASLECAQTLDYYDDEEPMPEQVKKAFSNVMKKISDLVGTLLFNIITNP